jgi:NAD(P)-dependent dehydrogenase (short-subunit alcohol dehydrogenase family)
MTAITGKIVLITGANRGIGRALLEEALHSGVQQVYAGTRAPFAHPDERVTNLILDVTDAAHVRRCARTVPSLDILVNNAGVGFYDELTDQAVLEHHLNVNFHGMYGVTQAFLPQLVRARGAIVNNLSVAAITPLPGIPAYSISKAAAYSLTQSQRTLLADRGVRVHAVFTGPTSTDMSRDLNAPKAAPESVARAIFDGVENGEEDIFPDSMSQTMTAGWEGGPAKVLEREYAAAAQRTEARA